MYQYLQIRNVIREKYSDNGILIFAGDLGSSDGPLTTTINKQGRILSHYLSSQSMEFHLCTPLPEQRTPPTRMKVSPTSASQPSITAHSIVYHLSASAPLLVTSPQCRQYVRSYPFSSRRSCPRTSFKTTCNISRRPHTQLEETLKGKDQKHLHPTPQIQTLHLVIS